MRKSSLAVESPAVWMNARRSVAAEAILALEKSKNWRRIVFIRFMYLRLFFYVIEALINVETSRSEHFLIL